LHWFRRPFPHRGPAWAVSLGAKEARRAHLRFHELWKSSHDIGPAIRRLMERTAFPQPLNHTEAGLEQASRIASSENPRTRETPAKQGHDPAGGRDPPVDTPSPPG